MPSGNWPSRLVRVGLITTLVLGVGDREWEGWGRAVAQDAPSLETAKSFTLHPDSEPLDLNHLKSGNTPPAVVTATTISHTGLTIPSLWWVWEQYAAQERYGNKLIENWIAYPGNGSQPGRIDFVVNRQLWSMIDYLERYTFIHEFGTVARSYGYNIRIFDNRANFLAAYTCDFNPIIGQRQEELSINPSVLNYTSAKYSSFIQPETPLTCAALLDYNGKSSLRGRPNLPGEGVSTPAGAQ
ncbi:hypothetical protein [Leptothermofonsia sp. ETS-13]|uniref:hypothetical protein n=1 Tax=Leptothermofonsia sp. ETS-13 TaxID=3035696 RepID=UPI003BA2F019